jgi:hypothetical protein
MGTEKYVVTIVAESADCPQGVIRGSEKAYRSEQGYLDKETYINLSHRISTVYASKDAVYSLFELYMKMKVERREYDAADR